MNLTEGQLFTIEALNRIEGFVWPEGMSCAGMMECGCSAWFFQGAVSTMPDFLSFAGWVTSCRVGVENPDWRNSLITREQFESVDGWVRHDNSECPVNSELQVQVKMHGFLGYSPSYPHIAKAWPWVNGGITHWRYHKPTKETEMKDAEQFQPPIHETYYRYKKQLETTADARKALEASMEAEDKLLEQIKAWNLEYGFDIRVLDESDEVPEVEPKSESELVITDWRDLHVGDVIWWSGDDDSDAGEYPVFKIEDHKYSSSLPIAVKVDDDDYSWIDTDCEQWKFIRRPSK